jgi:hypothetical protein
MARLFAGEFVAVNQDDVPPPLLQMQSGADADHPRTQHENIGLQFRHPALRKSNITRWLSLPEVKLAIAASPRKPAFPFREIALARQPNTLATWIGLSRLSRGKEQ